MTKEKLTEQEMRYRYARSTLVWRNLTKTLGTILKFGLFGWVFYWFFDAIKLFAGEKTDANILINLIFDMKIDKWIAYIFGAGGMIYGGVRNYQTKQTRKKHSEYIRKLEEKLDSARQKSRLNEYGETHEDDK